MLLLHVLYVEFRGMFDTIHRLDAMDATLAHSLALSDVLRVERAPLLEKDAHGEKQHCDAHERQYGQKRFNHKVCISMQIYSIMLVIGNILQEINSLSLQASNEII